MRTGELGRLALAACAGATIASTCLLAWLSEDERSSIASAPTVCDCTCGVDAELQPHTLESSGILTSRMPAPPQGISLLQVSSAPASTQARHIEGFHIAFGSIQHRESAWLSQSGNHTEDPTEVDRDEAKWLAWLREQLAEGWGSPVFEHKALEEEIAEHDTDFVGAAIWILLLVSIPVTFATMHGRETTWMHMFQSVAVITWIIWGLFMFCYVIRFESAHWKSERTLNLVESVYLMAQIITTVGYGDITPAHRQGQMVMGIFVLFGLIMLANLASQMGSLLMQHMDAFTQQTRKQTLTSALDRAVSTASMSGAILNPKLRAAGRSEWREWLHKTVYLTHMEGNLAQALILYLSLAVVGVVVFHYSEEKSWIEAVYMVIITSTSLGFGVVTPTTRHGFIFSACWMLCACAALALVIANFSQVMLMMERQEQVNIPKRRNDFHTSCDAVRRVDGNFVNRYEFTRLMLLYADMVQQSDLVCLENIFNELDLDGHSLVKIDAIENACFAD